MTDITQLARKAGFTEAMSTNVYVCDEDELAKLEQLLRDKFIAELGEPVYQVWNIECGFWEDCHKNHYDMSDDKRALYELKDKS